MITLAPGHILDSYGRPIPKRAKVRTQLAEALAKSKKHSRPMDAGYDAAGSGTEYSNIWGNADAYDADSANSLAVREKLVQRSRYEINNNGFSSGIAQTYANDLVGLGPTLRMQTGSEGFNRMVEREWYFWQKEVKFRRKLWCMAHAKHSDGESFGVLRQNRGLRHRIKLDLVLHETEQCQTPYLPYGTTNKIDGIEFDSFGNPTVYEFLRQHPGSSSVMMINEVERVPARFVMHWFKMIRPGQHRGMVESASTLNVGAAARRWREATLAAAENVADYSLFIKTMFEPDEIDAVDPMSTLDIQKRMMVALPAGYDAFQPKAEQPTANHAEFNKSLINEQARPKSMPYNKAACDSSSYNYASGRLDHQTYYGSLDVEREDCNDLVLDPLFSEWFDAAILTFGWLGGNPEPVTDNAKAHVWDWPKHQVADIKSEAAANDTRLKNGTTSLTTTYSDGGLDYEDELLKTASANGITVEQQRQINLLINVPQHAIQAVSSLLGIAQPVTQSSPPQSSPEQEEDEEDAE